jgi:hypothetical protein
MNVSFKLLEIFLVAIVVVLVFDGANASPDKNEKCEFCHQLVQDFIDVIFKNNLYVELFNIFTAWLLLGFEKNSQRKLWWRKYRLGR